ncbi:Acyl-coenzyme A thioesterase 13 [Polyrhizophydium stewartii]|uniref:Acyl-coenzyme A thioesterase 13 n=1 Tax=Polyrhizophydium stewartii TaxID=2732419 RepID=A0ABR4N396_9FUNG|nr:hypothetical protein HK105_007679 [Polyrhizophydium stewartii]
MPADTPASGAAAGADARTPAELARLAHDAVEYMKVRYGDPIYGANLLAPLRGVTVDFKTRTLVMAMEVPGWMLNSHKTMHGGAIMTLLDSCTSFAAGFFDPRAAQSMSVGVDIQFVAAPREGETVHLHCTANRVGGRLCFSTFRLTKPADDQFIFAKGSHTKYIVKPKL